MKCCTLILALFALAAQRPVDAQEGAAFDSLDLRVISSGATGNVVVDRGDSDRVEVGDRILLHPRQGGTYGGKVVRLNDRSAEVELEDKSYVPPPGTRGEVLIPRSRRARPKDEPADEPQEELTGQADPPPEEVEAETPERKPWENDDEGWSPGMPLLSQVRPVRPEDRAPAFVGRVYTIADQTWNGGSSAGFYRSGADLEFENPFGLGGGLHVDGEVNYRRTDVPDFDGEADRDLRLDRFSYFWGGTRYTADRVEVGRFLQHGLPELGVVDGAEWTRRLANGHRYGASAGFMPRPDRDFQSGSDFQVASWYEWVSDVRDQIKITGGLQQTWHNGAPDRELAIFKAEYLPPSGWDSHATAWIDLYDGSDVAKSGAEVTQAFATIGKREPNRALDFTYRRIRFPELLRHEFLVPVTLQALADSRYDRLSVSGWRGFGDTRRLHSQLGFWVDEDESGGDFDVGLEFEDLLLERSVADTTVFATRGEHSFSAGLRFTFGRYVDGGRWDVNYEIVDHHQDGFSSAIDDLLQHRVSASRSFYTESGWDVTVDVGTNNYDGETAMTLGLYVQKSFGR